jgi:bifunctional non-homologous end joining protein LigD
LWVFGSYGVKGLCAYSLRAREKPTVSTPVTWEELEEALNAERAEMLTFTADQVVERVGEKGDLFEPVRSLKQRLPAMGASQ